MAAFSADGLAGRFYSLRLYHFSRISAMPAFYKLALSAGMALATGLSAQARVYLPWTPVPVTGQTLAVLLSGAVLGPGWGGLSQIIYITLGLAGIPWFSGAGSGAGLILGPTGGYIAGFIPAAVLTGYFSEKHPRARFFLPMCGVMLAANFLFIHLFGLFHLAVWAEAAGAPYQNLKALLSASVLPFVPGDIMKIAAASLFVKAFTPKEKT
jgi:biotin transport system substrate-specific component